MALLVNPFTRLDEWQAALRNELPKEELRWWPEVGNPADIEYVIAWRLPRATLAECTNLSAILSLGAGVEQWVHVDRPGVPIVRLADPAMSDEMAAYSLVWVLQHQRNFAQAAASIESREWGRVPYVHATRYRVGILGYGTIGQRIGRAFAELGIGVNGWTRTPRDLGEVANYGGLDGLEAFLANSDAVINVLPSTGDTQGLLNAERLAHFRAGSLFVNIGRGSVLASEAELIDALDNGPLAAAVLDVTDPEPPPPESALYHHRAITLTPHIAGSTNVATAASLIAANVRRLRSGESPYPVYEHGRGY